VLSLVKFYYFFHFVVCLMFVLPFVVNKDEYNVTRSRGWAVPVTDSRIDRTQCEAEQSATDGRTDGRKRTVASERFTSEQVSIRRDRPTD